MEPWVTAHRPPLLLPLETLTVLEAGGLNPASQASALASYLAELRASRRSLLPDPSTISLWVNLASSELSWFLATFEQHCLHLRVSSLGRFSVDWRLAGSSCCLAPCF